MDRLWFEKGKKRIRCDKICLLGRKLISIFVTKYYFFNSEKVK